MSNILLHVEAEIINKMAYSDRHNETRISDERVFRMLEAIHTKSYERFIDIRSRMGKSNIREKRRKPGFYDMGCVCSAHTILQCVGRVTSKNKSHLEREIDYICDELGLIILERYKDNPSWYTRLELTAKGRQYLNTYHTMLDMVNYFTPLLDSAV